MEKYWIVTFFFFKQFSKNDSLTRFSFSTIFFFQNHDSKYKRKKSTFKNNIKYRLAD